MRTAFVKSTGQIPISRDGDLLTEAQIFSTVEDVLATTPVIDIHTHLFAPAFGKLGLWGIDELLTYHYLEAEFFRCSDTRPEDYWPLSKRDQADAIWRALFVENTPVSEATRGIIAVLSAFHLPTDRPDLAEARSFFKAQTIETHVHKVFQMAGVSTVVMTNDPLDPEEAAVWLNGVASDKQFCAVLRLDRILCNWTTHWHCRDLDVPLSLMIGVRKQVNPSLRMAGDALGRADLRALENLCREFPANRFLVSVLSRENQHELCVYARKFSNLMPFGCWWFMNNPSIVEEITRERIEMLGTSFIPQHSDARVLEQVIYKWNNTRRTLARILSDTYRLLSEDGRGVTRADIQRDVTRLFRSNAEAWTGPRVHLSDASSQTS